MASSFASAAGFTVVFAATLATALATATSAAADSIVLPVTVVERGIDSFPINGVFIGPQFDPGQATVTRTPNFEERALLEFDLSALPSDAVITSAMLQLTLSMSFQGQSSELHGYVGNGSYDNADLAVQNLLTAFTIATSSTALNISIPIAFIQARLTAGDQFAGFTLRNTTMPDGGVFSCWTDATPLQDLHPTLAIETEASVVPEPASIMLTASGLLLMLTRKSRASATARACAARARAYTIRRTH